MMTVPAITPSGSYVSDGTLTPRAIAFPFLSPSHIVVTVDDVAKVLNADYEISGVYPAATLAPLTGFASIGQTVRYLRQTEVAQDYAVSGNSINAKALETALDRTAMVMQEVKGSLDAFTNDVEAIAAPIAAAAASAVVIDIQAQIDAQALRGVYYDLPSALVGGTIGQFVGVAQPSLYAIDSYAKTTANDLVFSSGLSRAIGDGVLAKQRIATEASTSTPWPATPIYDLNPIDAKFNNGASIPNRSSPTPTRDIVAWDTGAFSPAFSAVVTPNYAADPFGGNTATRLQIASTSTPVPLLSATTFPTPVRLRFQAKSKAGAGNQTLYVSTAFSGGTAFALTEGAWTQVEFKTSAATQIYLITSGPALDIIASRPQVTPKEVLPPQPSVPRDGEGLLPVGAIDGSWPIDTRGNIIAPVVGRLKPSATGALRNFSAMTLIVTLKQTAADAGPYNGAWFAQAAGLPDLALGAVGTQIQGTGPGLNYINHFANNMLLGDEFVTLAFRFDASRSSFTLGSVELGTGTGTGGPVYPISTAYFGGGGYSDSFPFHGLIHKFTVFDSFLSDLALSDAVKRHQQSVALFGNTVGARNFGILLGDSITAGTGAASVTTCYAATTQNNLQPLKGLNLASPGTGLAYQVSLLPQILALIAAGRRDGKNMIVSCMIGVNGLPLISDYQTQLIDPIRAAGAKFIIYTTTSSSSVSDAAKDAFNAAQRTMTVDAVADIAADARLGGNGAWANATNFPDGLHPAQVMHDLMATLGTPAWQSLLV